MVDCRRNREKYVDSIFLEMGVLHVGSFRSSPVDSIKSSQIEEHNWRISVFAGTSQGSFGGKIERTWCLY